MKSNGTAKIRRLINITLALAHKEVQVEIVSSVITKNQRAQKVRESGRSQILKKTSFIVRLLADLTFELKLQCNDKKAFFKLGMIFFYFIICNYKRLQKYFYCNPYKTNDKQNVFTSL